MKPLILLPLCLVIEAILSVLAVKLFGAAELNPLCDWLIKDHMLWFVAMKVATAIGAYVFLRQRRFTAMLLTAWYGLLVLWNALIIVVLTC